MKSWKTPILNTGDVEEKRKEIKAYFNDSYDIYHELFKSLKNEDAFYERPEALRHPLIFYYGHTATFFINKLVTSKLYDQRVDDKFESMMAIGVDEMSWDDLDQSEYQWPTVLEVTNYRAKVKEIVNKLIDSLPLSIPIQYEDPFWVILMGIEHERIHLETSSVLIRQLALSQVQEIFGWPVCEESFTAPENELLEVSGGAVRLGRKFPAETYGWDNEFGELKTEVQTFNASKFLVSNREFRTFVEDSGYETQGWWTEEGWKWKTYKKANAPTFWIEDLTSDFGYRYRSVFSEIKMPENWPVDVNYLEAKAFCNWKSEKTGKKIRLPSEAEWYRIYDICKLPNHSDWVSAPGNINLEHYASASPVNKFMSNGFGDVVGNVWQWTETAIDAFDGFKVHPSYDDFSVPTFDGRHNLIKGGSWISTGNASVAESRFAFRRHFYQHAGFRYIESEEEIVQEFNIYETDSLISQYLEFHYGDEYFGVPNFPKACIDKVIEITKGKGKERAFDLGCAVGRGSFELARYFEHVDAVDFSTRFIRNALQLRDHESLRYMIPIEGEIMELKEFRIEALGMGEGVKRVEFLQGDASNLLDKYSDYDLVFAGNLIDRLYDPAKFLKDIQARIRKGGVLVLTSPYTWLEEYTEKEAWIGGRKVNGENITSYEGLKGLLSEAFSELCDPMDIPFVIRESARKHQHTIAQMTAWVKK